MKATLTQKSPIHYISDADIIRFIETNSDMEWNTVCDFVREHSITSCDGDRVYWEKSDITNNSKNYNEEQVKWVGNFFEAHPWIEKMMVVFDD